MNFGRRRVVVHLIFYGSIVGGFWSFLCRPGWRHCLLVMTLYYPRPHVFARRYSMIVNPCGWGLHLDVIWRKPEDVVQEFIDAGVSAVIKATVDLPPGSPYILRGVFSCVSTIKAALGLRNWRIITPYGLFRFMLANGAEVIFRSAHDGHDREFSRVREETGGDGAGPCNTGGATARRAAVAGGRGSAGA